MKRRYPCLEILEGGEGARVPLVGDVWSHHEMIADGNEIIEREAPPDPGGHLAEQRDGVDNG